MTGSPMNGKSVWGRFVLGLGACVAVVLLAPILIGLVKAVFIPLVVLIALAIAARLVWFFTGL
jgi:hypothetical protein